MENRYLAFDPSVGAPIDTLLARSITYRIARGLEGVHATNGRVRAGALGGEVA
jgi:hypothetical protein